MTDPECTRRVIEPAMGTVDAEHCRKEAEECRREAERALSPIDRESWLKLEAQWIELARRIEQTSR